MPATLVDSSVILDVFEAHSEWCEWSENALAERSKFAELLINAVIYAEISIGFSKIETLETAVSGAGFRMVEIPKEALFLAGKAFLNYRRKGGARDQPLPDFFIGAHAAVAGLPLLTRDTGRVRTYFPSVKLISPKGNP